MTMDGLSKIGTQETWRNRKVEGILTILNMENLVGAFW